MSVPSSEQKNETWWINGIFVLLAHLVAIYAFLYYPVSYKVQWLTYICWQLATLGITMGYHRLWSHRAFKASFPLKVMLALMGTMGFQGSAKWWVLRHRLHHRYTDTDHDPYDAKKGLWFSHIGWIFEKPFYPRMKYIEQEDLNSDPVVVFQHKYFVPLAFACGFGIPTLIGALWGEALGAFLYCGFIARILIWHVTFCINSLAHYIGDQEYSDEMTARGNLLLAIITNGEGYHNFHHEFPNDYRNGVLPHEWDPTKWLIWGSSKLGLAWDLRITPDNEIIKAKILTAEKKVAEYREQVTWGPETASLKSYTPQQFNDMVQLKKAEWIIIDDIILDVRDFKERHPGGAKLIDAQIGKDATKAFYGILNNHTLSARTYLKMLAVGKIDSHEGIISGEGDKDK
ncbi:uncharacterized protein BJ171DRAFT_587932 [Polychytrium aggregatum]|uniref:uncharacterized protein n=1 Tax=Polychytrium aggregatum TaxID=110093 RepID=UPI0022FF1CCB|nr:uncharacterized protein BJ171DRAFT_587932 [Polychytrium aggregatum]KAI9193252.1 hypothetical protein BJ171DRAFT_587932 [Polychytrium aggregatum]